MSKKKQTVKKAKHKVSKKSKKTIKKEVRWVPLPDTKSKNQIVGAVGGLLAAGVTLLAAKAVIDTTQTLATGKKVPNKQRATHYTTKGLNYMLGKK